MGTLYSLEMEALYGSESNNLLPKKNEMRLTKRAPDGGYVPRFSWLQVGSGKVAFSHPTPSG